MLGRDWSIFIFFLIAFLLYFGGIKLFNTYYKRRADKHMEHYRKFGSWPDDNAEDDPCGNDNIKPRKPYDYL
ncbi:MAG: hypothetical protein ACOX3L_07630 [Lutisporaceae bacterium]|jgi:hypothetical protein